MELSPAKLLNHSNGMLRGDISGWKKGEFRSHQMQFSITIRRPTPL